MKCPECKKDVKPLRVMTFRGCIGRIEEMCIQCKKAL